MFGVPLRGTQRAAQHLHPSQTEQVKNGAKPIRYSEGAVPPYGVLRVCSVHRGVRRTNAGHRGHLPWIQMTAPPAEMDTFAEDVPGCRLVIGSSHRQQYRVPSLTAIPAG